MPLFETYIDKLARTEVADDAFNQYAYGNDANTIRRENLRLYLHQMTEIAPRILMVGEAPGYKGCRLTGVPFSNEYLLVNGIDSVGLFGQERGYRKTDETAKAGREQTATIIWETALKLNIVPLAWNAFPFHPHKAGNTWSNRTPRASELRLGGELLSEFVSLFEIETIIAVGNKAEATLQKLNVPCAKVRHPAQGGKRDFVAGMTALVR
ncbi:MAG: uracil-DNA glycosylase [Chloroflexi bacterium]|nr:MAG: uracil-DNA glycosylase [Phototrophicales bacterium]RMF82853.1 MAG: uracil-DNA glycosylase [Chloroflexota bacterium]